jgi:hypothetical protein
MWDVIVVSVIIAAAGAGVVRCLARTGGAASGCGGCTACGGCGADANEDDACGTDGLRSD